MKFGLKGHLAVGALFWLGIAPGLSAQEAPAASTQTVPAMPPLHAYGELPGVEDVALSESGERIAMITRFDGKRVLLAISQDGKAISASGVGDLKIRSIQWIGEDSILMVSSETQELGRGFTTDKAEVYLATVIPVSDTAGASARRIFADEGKLLNAVFGNYGVRKIAGRWYAFFGAVELASNGYGYHFEHGRPSLYRVDLQDMSVKRIARSAPANSEYDWVVGANGELLAQLKINNGSGRWELDGPDGKKIAEGKNPLGRLGLIGLGYDGTTVIMTERTEDGVEWYEIPLEGGERKVFLKGAHVDRLYFDRLSGRITGYLEGGPTPVPVMHAPAHQDAVAKVRQAFANFESRMVEWTDDFNKVLVKTSGNENSGTWFNVDVGALEANAIAFERPVIMPEQVGRISVFEYTASDGLEMDGILTLPPEREATNLPAIVLPHGGPRSHDTEGFDWWAQAFASRGYAVFQPNFRGSTNRDGSFAMAGNGEWGRKMQSDKSDGLAALVEEGIVDPSRVCIVGASYGGYAALAGVTLQQGLYRCAVAVAPVSDIRNMFEEDYKASGRERTTRRALIDQLGPSDRWNDVSPLRAAEQADAPILLIHGIDDTIVPYSHSRRMADKLKDAGKPYTLVQLEGEDHWLSLSETRKRMLSETMAFVQAHNPAD